MRRLTEEISEVQADEVEIMTLCRDARQHSMRTHRFLSRLQVGFHLRQCRDRQWMQTVPTSSIAGSRSKAVSRSSPNRASQASCAW